MAVETSKSSRSWWRRRRHRGASLAAAAGALGAGPALLGFPGPRRSKVPAPSSQKVATKDIGAGLLPPLRRLQLRLPRLLRLAAAPRESEPAKSKEADDEKATHPTRQRDFWRWTAGIGWTMNLLLLSWAIFLREMGRKDSGQAGSKKAEPLTYERILDRGIDQERSIAQSDGQVQNLLENLKKDLQSLRNQFQDLLRPSEEVKPNYEDVAMSKFIDETEEKVDRNQLQLERRGSVVAKQLMDKEQEKKFKEQAKQSKAQVVTGQLVAKKTRGYSPSSSSTARVGVAVDPQPQPQWTVNEDMMGTIQNAALPVGLSLAAILLVTWLSKQFVRVSTDWRRSRYSQAERMRKVQLRRLVKLRDLFLHSLDELGKGKMDEAGKDFNELVSGASKYAQEPTWEEVAKLEAAAFWDRWGPEAFKLEAVLPKVKEAPKDAKGQAKWVMERWASSAQGVVKDSVETALSDWADDEPVKLDAMPPKEVSKKEEPLAEQEEEAAKKKGTGLVIRIFGRWDDKPEDWVSIANVPLAGGWREKALRLLIPAEKDVRDMPVLGPLCDLALTATVEKQVRNSLSTSPWGGLTTDLWSDDSKPFQIGYEVIEVESKEPEEMCAIARSLPKSGTPGRVVAVKAGLESKLGGR